MAFKTSKMDHIALEYWYNSFFRAPKGRWKGIFFSKSQSWKKVRQTRNQDAAHAQKCVTVPVRVRAAQERFKVASAGPEVASELAPYIFDFFDLFFHGKEIIRMK